MHVRFLGVHNTERAEERLAGVLADGVPALGAGSLARSLAHLELERGV